MNRLPLALGFAAALGACGPGEVGPDGGGDDQDGGGGIGGLVFQFRAAGLDKQLDELVVNRLDLHLTNLRAIGDVAPGLQTYRDEQDVELHELQPVEVRFDQAPPGRYSAFEFSLERPSDTEAAWSLEGELELGGERYELEIHDEQTSTLSLPLGELDLGAGQTMTVAIEVDLEPLADVIDWDDAPIDDNEVVIDDESPLLLGALRLALLASFEVVSITPE